MLESPLHWLALIILPRGAYACLLLPDPLCFSLRIEMIVKAVEIARIIAFGQSAFT
jgi:hypothetical protein